MTKALISINPAQLVRRSEMPREETLSLDLEEALSRLRRSIASGLSRGTQLGHWSQFIRLRDGNRCLNCESTHRVSAHHICRKTFMPEAQLETGNGVTLCENCHRAAHRDFNGRPDMQLLMDEQGGEKIEILAELYGALLNDAINRGLLNDDFYFLGDKTLERFKYLQGFRPDAIVNGGRLEQAFLIWNQCPRSLRDAVLSANGFNPDVLSDVLPAEMAVVFELDNSEFRDCTQGAPSLK